MEFNLFSNNNMENNFKYVNCSNDDKNCDRYKDKYNISETVITSFMVISHIIPFIYCCYMCVDCFKNTVSH